ncbi:MAG: Ca-activated chloride channel [Acidobacteriota bacterium]|nr:Ca-activated chloride channel [Acidobacteriota bacterium]
MKKIRFFILMGLLAAALCCSHCSSNKTEFSIISGSENKPLESILMKFAGENNIHLDIHYKGSVDIMMELGKDQFPYDAVWPANSLWISLGDKNHVVKHMKSIMISPVVFGVRKSLAEKLGLVGKDVYVRDILAAIREKKLTFMMTSATQSNSGASAYIGFLYALLGNPDMITKEDLRRPGPREQIRELLKGINRSSGSSGWLKDLFLKGNYDAMVNYEAVIIEANRELVRQGKEPLYVIYPVDGIVLADSPFGYVNKGDSQKEETFKKLQVYLLSDEAQKEMLRHGRRTGFGGITGAVDKQVFNPQWGIQADKILSPLKLPPADVILEALHLYQTEFRKPSLTIFCLDFSGSMEGEGDKQLKQAMGILLDQRIARQYLIQAAGEEVIVVIPFSSSIMGQWQVLGNDEQQLGKLLDDIVRLAPSGGTDIYSPVIQGLNIISQYDPGKYMPAIILMTDGESNTGKNIGDVKKAWQQLGLDIPIFSIMFGKASQEQLNQLAELSRARVFDGRKDLVNAFREVKGYN